eukprot:2130637-Alexandrium_andersonii.AAC.1
MKEAAEKIFGNSERPKKRPWIGPDTLELLESRDRLTRQGNYMQADQLSKQITKSARMDRRRWVEAGLEEKFWDP